jgi:hypothetical protein
VLYLAYLARRPDTRQLRLAVLPLAIYTALRTGFGYVFDGPGLNSINFGLGALKSWLAAAMTPLNASDLGLFGVAVSVKSFELTIPKDGMKKIGEKSPGIMATSAIVADQKRLGNGTPNGVPNGTIKYRSAGPRTFYEGFQDGLELLVNLRGIGWEFGTGTGIYIPPHTRDISNRSRFVQQTFRSLILNFLAVDLIESFLKFIPSGAGATGGTIYLPSLPPVPRYAFASFLHFVTGCAFMAGFNMVYGICTLIGVIILQHEPSSWPPLFEAPWASDSMHTFWSKSWHQLLRQTFLVSGGYPFQKLFGLPGLIFGTFLASGFYHNFAMYAMGQGLESAVVWYFVWQGVGIACERAWKIFTGRRVRGPWGMIWAYICVIGGGQRCSAYLLLRHGVDLSDNFAQLMHGIAED